jgi:PAS domain S-box-containing protein
MTADEVAEAKKRWEQRFFSLSLDPCCVAGFDGYFKHVNPAFCQTLGYTEKELLSIPYLDMIHPDDVESTSQEAGKNSEGVITMHFVNRYRHKNGSYRHFAWTSSPQEDEQLIYATVRDITEVEELREALRERKSLLARLVAAQEQERRRIAGDIHDDALQSMIVAQMRLAMLTSSSETASDTKLDPVVDGINDAVTRLRTLTADLHPRILDSGVKRALESKLDQLKQEVNCPVSFTAALSAEPADHVSATLFRIGQEALNNVRKHAPGAPVSVSIVDEGGYTLRVHDDGPGFTLAVDGESPEGHLGLTSMRERAEALEGTLEIASAAGTGTTVTAWLPAEAARVG